MGERPAILADHPAEVAAQRRDGNIVANIQRRELLRKVVAVRVREHPLRKIIRKTLRKEMMAAQSLKRVVKNGRVAAMLETRQKFRERSRGLVADACEIGNGHEFKRSLCIVHPSASSIRLSVVVALSSPCGAGKV